MSSSVEFDSLFNSNENFQNESEHGLNFSDYDVRPLFNGSEWLDTETGNYTDNSSNSLLTNLTAALAVFNEDTNTSIDPTVMYDEFSNETMATLPSLPPTVKPAYIFLLFLLFSVFTVFGNVLVILAVCRERALQTVTNYFVVSLAVADVLVATVPMPFGVYVLVSCPQTFNFISLFLEEI